MPGSTVFLSEYGKVVVGFKKNRQTGSLFLIYFKLINCKTEVSSSESWRKLFETNELGRLIVLRSSHGGGGFLRVFYGIAFLDRLRF